MARFIVLAFRFWNYGAGGLRIGDA